MTPRVVVLSDEKDLALCHPEERSEEGSRVWFNQNQRLDPSGGETALRMTIPSCRPEQSEGPGVDCHSERSEESGFALFKIQIRFFVLTTRTQNDNTRFFRPSAFRMTRIEILRPKNQGSE